MPYAKITGLGFYVPENVVTNHDLTRYMNTSDEWIRERTGIEQRRFFTEGKDTTAKMGARAAAQALERAGITAEEIDFIVFATLSPDYFFPGSGVLLQRLLPFREIGALDVRAQCSGFIYALSVADQYIRSGMYKKILVVGSEIQSNIMELSDRGRAVAVLFGDGAGAAVVEATDEPDHRILSTHLHSDGNFAEDLFLEHPGAVLKQRLTPQMIEEGKHLPFMRGNAVFKHAITRFPEVIREALDANGYTIEDLDLLVPHQANLRIAQHVQKTLGLRDDQVFNNIQKYGNTTAASIPIALTEAWEAGKVKPGDLVCLAAFGSGFTWASALIRW
ncbi:3-oxoacyl-[acyl-carrier-protein] synthase-3 [Thermonema lapsum]|uniref:Beta-ketoacyl-[acyl-carrier-protein] synthase III n=1 Tax=Thermonema lapsum TaxID=28195 RepID=A0A846MM00_9BACT|nr:beta-ketoacyl-ACP synthase III [Thermonema lapsum]NIK72548.1 3-oxoacyl-[acyl-carrier-protein] synthase-3 [Thermonema lapsum]